MNERLWPRRLRKIASSCGQKLDCSSLNAANCLSKMAPPMKKGCKMQLNARWAQAMRVDILAGQLQDARWQANVMDESLSRCITLTAAFATTGAAAGLATTSSWSHVNQVAPWAVDLLPIYSSQWQWCTGQNGQRRSKAYNMLCPCYVRPTFPWFISRPPGKIGRGAWRWNRWPWP